MNKYATTPMVPIIVSATKAMHSTMMGIHVEVGLIYYYILFCVPTNIFFYMLREDVDECRDQIDECDQDCENIVGSYLCSCCSGFILDLNGKSCKGN